MQFLVYGPILSQSIKNMLAIIRNDVLTVVASFLGCTACTVVSQERTTKICYFLIKFSAAENLFFPPKNTPSPCFMGRHSEDSFACKGKDCEDIAEAFFLAAHLIQPVLFCCLLSFVLCLLGVVYRIIVKLKRG